MDRKELAQIVRQYPFPDYSQWWDIGPVFTAFMSEAIVSQWIDLPHNDSDLGVIKRLVADYLHIVFSRQVEESLVDNFVNRSFSNPLRSGEFDAPSFAFFHSAFDLIQNHPDDYERPLDRERRRFTKKVGKDFFKLMRDYLGLALPANLNDEHSFGQLKQ